MEYKLSTYKLGQLLKVLNENYDMALMAKIKLSGGFMTLSGKPTIEHTPSEKAMIKGNNIISINVKNDNEQGATLKITGVNNGDFNIDIAPTKFRNLKSNGLGLVKIQENVNECKLRIDDDMIFTVKTSMEEIEKHIK